MRYFTVLFLSSILFISCADDQIVNFISLEDAVSGVVSKKEYTMDLNQMISVEDYEYNQGKLIKKIYYDGNRESIIYYEKFYYDNNGRLKNKTKYNSHIYSPTGFITIDSTVYSYSSNLLISQKIIYPQAKTFDEVTYEYHGRQLNSESFYSNGNYMDKIVYKYDNEGRVQSATHYNNEEESTTVTKYIYQDDYLKEAVWSTYNDELLTKTSYRYNNDGKLIKEIVEVFAGYLSIGSHIVVYEY